MNEFFQSIFHDGPFMPHGHCYLWTPGLLWLHVVSDALIVFSYFTIPITLIYFVRRRQDMRFGWIFVCFAVFIIACGTTHLMEIWNVWHANYWLAGAIKAITAMASVPTAYLLTRLVAPALKMPSMADLEKLNLALEQEVATRTKAEELVRQFNVELEHRVQERTAEVHAANADLRRQIDERQRAEVRFRQLADAMPQIVWATRPDGTVDYYNEQWHKYTGLPVGATEGGWEAALHPADLSATRETWERSLRSGEPYQVECRLKRATDGAFRWHLGRARPIRGEDGQIVRWFGTHTDIHDSKQFQEEREQLLTSERAARSESERVSHLKDEFLATLSHELRTPLNSIFGWAQILQSGNVSTPDLEQGLTTIERNARAQRQIIDDLLDMSAVISGKLRMNVQTVDLAALVQTAVETLRPAAAAKHIRFQVNLDARHQPISGDPARLQQVLWNLLNNAIKFTPKEGQVQVVLEDMYSHLKLTVKDSGEGIKPDFLPYVFDRFRQEDASTTRRHGGLGLGLSIVKHLVELHGGAVSANSGGPGQGASFAVVLPLAATFPAAEPPAAYVPPAASAVAPAAAAIPRSGTDQVLAGIKVVVVDDEPDARVLVQRLLEGHGARVRVAGSGEEAVALLLAEAPDLLVSDIGMPGENGYELVRRVRNLETDVSGIPALALTAYVRPEDRTKAIRAGFQTHLSKPIEAAELLKVVANLVGRGS